MHSVLLTAAAVAIGGPVDFEQFHTLDQPVSDYVVYDLDSGGRTNAQAVATTVFAEVITVQDAGWLRLYFGEVILAPGSAIRVTSLLDGEVQNLDATELAKWGNTSAYFNGDSVLVELVAAPKTAVNRFVINQLGVPKPIALAGNEDQCGICGDTDDRVPSTELWTARLFPAGCTASIYNEGSCMVSAGHCIGGNMVVQFNVPPSNAGCSTNNPPIADQFPIIAADFDNNNVGDDWSVLLPATNNQGQLPYDRYGELRRISSVEAVMDQNAQLTGYGVDLTCVRSQTQQFAEGPICSVQADHYRFGVDLRGGNSGSSLISNGEIIGIATHCPCCNAATKINNPDFLLARAALCPFPPVNDECSGAIALTQTVTPINNLTATSGGPALPPECDQGAGLSFENDVWYTYTPDCPNVYLSLCVNPLTFDARLALYEESCGELNLVDCAYDNCVPGPTILFTAECGRTYYVRVGANGDEVGTGSVWAACSGECPVICEWDCADDNGEVGIVDFLELLAQWGQVGTSCDFDGGGVGIVDFLKLLANWGQCP